MARPDPAVLVLWERMVGEILDRTAAFPKHTRHSFVSRIDGLALDVLAELVRARFAPRAHQEAHLRVVDGHLAVLRTLLRLATDRRLMSVGALEALSRGVEEAGRMIGGWITSLRSE